MVKFINFFKKIYVFILFIVLEILALNFYARSTNYNRAKLLTQSNIIIGSINNSLTGISDYFGLKEQNEILLAEVVQLRNRLANSELLNTEVVNNDNAELAPYFYSSAQVVGNSTNKQNNYITLNKGQREGFEANMALVSTDGCMVGYIISCSDKFAVASSVLNSSFNTSGKIKGQDYFGSVSWNGLNHQYVQLSELPKYADINKGDTIITTSYSSIFPEGIVIGTVEDFELEKSTHYNVKVRLAANFSSLNNVLIIKYQDYAERQLLEENAMKD